MMLSVATDHTKLLKENEYEEYDGAIRKISANDTKS